jgi:hypothetical protein
MEGSQRGQQSADWIAPATVFEYAPVPLSARRDVVTLDPEVAIGGDLEDPNTLFYRALHVAVNAAGRLFVLDAGNHRIQAFNADGSFAMSLGREGQGPGEFRSPAGIAIVGDRVVVWDRPKRRLVTWDLSGEIKEEISLDGVQLFREMRAIGSSSLLVVHTMITPGRWWEESVPQEVFIRSFEMPTGEFRAPFLRMDTIYPDSGGWAPWPTFAVDPRGRIYLSTSEEYEIRAYSVDGSAQWAIRVDWPRESTAERVAMTREALKGSPNETIERYVAGAPQLEDALGSIRVDGHGHIYVFPTVTRTAHRAFAAQLRLPRARPVDVYSRDGEHLFSGAFAGPLWRAALGDHVYYRDTDEETEEALFVRARLNEPF